MSLALQVENLSKVYSLGALNSNSLREDISKLWRSKQADAREFWALQDVSFDVKQGEVLGVIGKNGAGKSTLLKILSKVTAPTRGQIKIKGRVASLLEVGTGFHPDLTGRENIFLNGAILGMNKAEIKSKFDEIIAFSGVEKFIDTPVKRYSSGMYVRLAFAIAAHLEPEILIVDEVLAVGDLEFQKRCLGKMQDVSTRDGRTVLFVSHNMGAVADLCNRVLFLENGKTKTIGSTSEVIREYLAEQKNISENTLNTQNRIGNGKIHFTSFTITDNSGTVLESVLSGQDINFSLSLQVNQAREYKQFHASVAITDEFEQPVFHLSTTEGNGAELSLSGKEDQFIITCNVIQLPLPPGKYYIHLYCSDMSEAIDDLRYAASFDVLSGNYFGNGKTLDKKWGLAYLHSKWSIQE